MQLSKIFLYPIKSLRGIPVSSAKVEARGLQYDRRWMIVDDNGALITQREIPAMTFLQPSITDTNLLISHTQGNVPTLEIPLEPGADARKIQVRVWDDVCKALEMSDQVNEWFSKVLGVSCRLTYMPDDTLRPTDQNYSLPTDIVSFADSFPFMIIGQASLNDLNQRLDEPVEIERFRPNFVFTNGKAYEEDHWQKFSIGNLTFRGAKDCARCKLITINPTNAEVGLEPLRTLATYRKSGRKINFGRLACWNVDEQINPVIKIGDQISILQSLSKINIQNH